MDNNTLPFAELEIKALVEAIRRLEERISALEDAKDEKDDERTAIVDRFLDFKYPQGAGLDGMRPAWVQGIFYEWARANGVEYELDKGGSRILTNAIKRRFGFKIVDDCIKGGGND